MRHAVKEIFYTLQGEGFNSGRPAVFCRFTGCNLWSGREEDRASAACNFCDTDFVGTDGLGGGRFENAASLGDSIDSYWGGRPGGRRFVVFTGGEPLLQLNEELIRILHDRDFEVAVETNGTCPAPHGLDWVCVSPKGKTQILLRAGDELKLVYPQAGVDPEDFSTWQFDHFFL